MTEQPATAVAEQLTLGELIAVLETADPTTVLPIGFDTPHSYRGYYEQLAFEPATGVTVGQMLGHARDALGATFEGYKGGLYTMREDTDCWVASWGACGEELTAERLRDMLTAGQTATAPANSIPIHGHMPPAADIETILADPGGACPDCVRIVIEGFRAEVKRLRKELDQVRRAGEEELEYAAQRYAMADAMRGDACIERDQARAERDAARVGMEKLRGLHRGVCVGACGLDDACECEERDLACDECSTSWPCATIRALDGTEAGQ